MDRVEFLTSRLAILEERVRDQKELINRLYANEQQMMKIIARQNEIIETGKH